MTKSLNSSGVELGVFDGPSFDSAFASAMRKANACTPPDVNGAGRTVMSPSVLGPGACIQPLKLSNLDLNGRLVKRGLTVSYHGLRYQVIRVRAGVFVGRVPSRQVGKLFEREDRLTCESVQVVA